MTLDAGFRQDGMLVVNLDLRARRRARRAARPAFFADAHREARARCPASRRRRRRSSCRSAAADGTTTSSSTAKKYPQNVNFNAVSAGYFRTMGTPLLAGRDFDERERRRRRAVGDRHRARSRTRSSPDANPIGQMFQIDEPPGRPRPLHPDRRRGQGHEVHRPARGIHAARVLLRVAGRTSRIRSCRW